jgi:hypothetical protein
MGRQGRARVYEQVNSGAEAPTTETSPMESPVLDDSWSHWPPSFPDPAVPEVTLRSQLAPDLSEKLDRLEEKGWIAEPRLTYWIARRGHRRIELFLDGRVVFKDPTIRARSECDDEWLAAMRIVRADPRF